MSDEGYTLSESAVRDVAATVRDVRGRLRTTGRGEGRERAMVPWLVPVILDEDLTATAPALGRRMYPADADDWESVELTAGEGDEQVPIYPWEMTGYKMSEGRKGWAARFAGRLWLVIPDGCLEDA